MLCETEVPKRYLLPRVFNSSSYVLEKQRKSLSFLFPQLCRTLDSQGHLSPPGMGVFPRSWRQCDMHPDFLQPYVHSGHWWNIFLQTTEKLKKKKKEKKNCLTEVTTSLYQVPSFLLITDECDILGAAEPEPENSEAEAGLWEDSCLSCRSALLYFFSLVFYFI